MKYFGGSGSGTGWNTFKFVLLPGEFENLFSGLGYYFVITNQRVDAAYKVDDKSSVFRNYDDLFAKITSGQSWDQKKDWKLAINTAIIDDRNKIYFRDVTDEQGKIYPYFQLLLVIIRS